MPGFPPQLAGGAPGMNPAMMNQMQFPQMGMQPMPGMGMPQQFGGAGGNFGQMVPPAAGFQQEFNR